MSILQQNLEPFQKDFVNNTLDQYKTAPLRSVPYRIFMFCFFAGILCQFLELTSEKVSGLVDFSIYFYVIGTTLITLVGVILFHTTTGWIETHMYGSCVDPNRRMAHVLAKNILIFERPKNFFQYWSDVIFELIEIGCIILLVLQGWKLAAVIMIGIYLISFMAKRKIHSLNFVYVDSLTPETIQYLENPENNVVEES